MRIWPVLLCLLLAGCLQDQDPLVETPAPVCPGLPLEEIWDVRVKDMQGGARLGETSSQRVPVAWSTSLPPNDCIRSLEVQITWTNTLTSGGDLYVGIEGGGSTFAGHDQQQVALDGRHTEDLLVPIGASGLPADALQDLTVWIHTDWATASDGGLRVTVQITLHPA